VILVALFAALGMSLEELQPAHAAAVNCADELTTGVPQAECETLVALYTSTNGPGWTDNTNWNTATNVGDWHGVAVSSGHVTRLNLYQNQLSENLPDLSALTYLRWLTLSYNQLNGNIPNLSSLIQLEYLQLQGNQLTGSIPDLSGLAHLKQLWLDGNQLTGDIPELLALTQLELLSLPGNQLSGNIPNLSTLTHLRTLNLPANQLSGTIPDLSALTDLEILSLSDNQLSGSIPDLSALSQMYWLAFDHNQLSGGIPDLSAFSELVVLKLSHNQLSGTIPDLSALTHLEILHLSENQLSGSIPDLSTLIHLNGLYLDHNQLVSTIPSSITATSITTGAFTLCGGNNIITSDNPTVIDWVQERDPGWTQGCGLGTVPSATDDPNYTVGMATPITVSSPGVLANDFRGIPDALVTFFSGQTPGEVVTDHAAGTTISPLPGYGDGSLRVNADGSFLFISPTGFTNSFSFQYRIDNRIGISDATVTIHVSDLCTQPAITGVPDAECETLVAFYNSTNGPSWANQTNWNTSTNVDTWNGVTVANGHVTELVLQSNQLSGSIPDLSALSQIQNLKLKDNELRGNIPDLSALTQLQYLWLMDNQLNGSIPDLSTLTQLLSFGIRNNQLESVIPPTITSTSISPEGDGGLELCGGSNIITSDNPAVIAWIQARDPGWTQGCGLGTGPIAIDDLAYTTSKNVSLQVRTPGIMRNDTLGIPVATVTSFGGGSLGGALTDHAAGTFVSPLPGYGDGSLQLNADGSFIFAPPTGFTGFYTVQYRLSNVMAASNATVTINVSDFCTKPATTGVPQAECEALVTFYNSTNGPGWQYKNNWNTATNVGTWDRVAVSDGHVIGLTLFSNQLSGSIPDLSAFGQLVSLDLHNNQLTGSIPELSALRQLQALNLTENQLSGNIPDLSDLTQLRTLSLSKNHLSGNIPDLSALTQLTGLSLSNNQLSGSIPDLSSLAQLQVIWLNDNVLTGSISDLSTLTQLRYVRLYNNRLSGSIPDLAKLTQLEYFHLGNNQLSGSIPDLSTLTNLIELALNNNQLSGNIPDLSALTKLELLGLQNNQLSGSIPDLSNLSQLQILSLSNNQLVSIIPPSITGTSMLTANLYLCGGNNIISSPDPGVIAWVQAHDAAWTQACGLGTAPTAADDPSHATGANTTLSVEAQGVLENDITGTPAGIITFFGGGSLTGTVADRAAGTAISPLPGYSDGSLVVNADGSFDFTPPTDFLGAYTFQYRLDNGVGASDATVTIQTAPGFSVDDVSGFESSAGTITFTITLTCVPEVITTVDYVTVDGTATAGSDYIATGGTLTFDPGITTQPIVVKLRGDAVVEGSETFFVKLSNPTNAVITDDQGQGTIRNSTVKPLRPAHNTLTRDNTPTFSWARISGAVEYQLQVDNNATFASPVISQGLTTNAYTPSAALADGKYYWRVRARDAAGNWGGWCTRWTVTVDVTPPAKPTLLTPANGSTVTDSTPSYRWNPVNGAVKYTLQMDDNSTFSSPIINRTQTTTSYTQPSTLTDKKYYWRLRAQDKAGNWSAWGARWSFMVNAVPIAQPTLIPTNTPRPTRTPNPTLVPTVMPTAIPTMVPTATPTEITPRLQTVETDNLLVVKSGRWSMYGELAASGGTYLLSSTPADTLDLAFAGSEVIVVYIKHPAMGSFAIAIDGIVMQIVDGIASEAVFGAEATISGLVYRQHTVRVYPMSGVVAIDAFKVETPLEIVAPTQTPVPTDVPTDIPVPTGVPTDIPTEAPTETPIPTDTLAPTDIPTETPDPTAVPTEPPPETPTAAPTETPTDVPTEEMPVPDATEEPAS
jgi:Leucine-rich repeat (LRR) protein